MLPQFYIDLYSINEIPMTKFLLSICLTINLLYPTLGAQDCEITAVTAVALPCQGNNFSVSVNLQVNNPASPGFTLAGNGVIYGTYLYSDLPVVIGPLVGDDESLTSLLPGTWKTRTVSNSIPSQQKIAARFVRLAILNWIQ